MAKSDLTMPLLFALGGLGLLVLSSNKTPAAPALNANVSATLPPSVQTDIAQVLKSFGVDEQGIVRGPVSPASINVATTLAVGLESMGYRDAAATVRQYIVLAQNFLRSSQQ